MRRQSHRGLKRIIQLEHIEKEGTHMNGYVLAYIGGILTGAGLLFANHKSIETALKKSESKHQKELGQLRTENAQLRRNYDDLERSMDCTDAFRRGRQAGRNDPATEAERFARTFEGRRNVQFKDTSKQSA